MTVEAPRQTPHETPDAGALSKASRQALLDLARRAVHGVANRGPQPGGAGSPEAGPAPLGLERLGAVFVTLRVADQLRGCIGSFEPHASLWSTVHEMALAAATRDPRFAPVSAAELEHLSIEISVLSPPRLIRGPSDIVIGRHGLEVRQGSRRGVLLPQVATDHDLDVETFLGETCRKAGLDPLAWRDPGVEIRVFEAEIFGE